VSVGAIDLWGLSVAAHDEFPALDEFRAELLVHCYRMLGSAEEAEDVVQETYLRAWRSYAGFEGRSSARTWLYRIATNACLTAIDRRGRRPLPSGLGGPSDDPAAPVAWPPEMPWLRPLPDALLAAEHLDPAAVTASRAGVRLAMVAALQYLPARQRAVLLLRDVLNWPAAEVADLLDTTATAVNSGLRRAGAQIARVLPAEEEVAEPAEPDLRALLDRFAAAFEDGDMTALAALLREDVALEMPPLATWFSGRETVLGYLSSHVCTEAGRLRLVPAAANGQPAFAAYLRDADGAYRAHAMIVLTLTGALVTRIVIFLEPALFRLFGLDRELAPGESGDCGWSTSLVGPTEVAAPEQVGEDGNVNEERERRERPPEDRRDADPGVDRGLCHLP
jgi:RNA polymerase sigma-70 factor (ECF subfamily)